MANKPLAALHPEWNVDQSVIDGLDGTLDLDAQPTTRAIRAKAETPEEINQMFDGIAYGKASDVLLTVENYLGRRHSAKAYTTTSWLTATPTQPRRTSGMLRPPRAINRRTRSWNRLVTQPGAPIITFGKPAAGKVTVEQKRFFLSPSIQPDLKQKWMLPVCFKGTNGAQDCQLLTPETTTLTAPAGPLLFANADGKVTTAVPIRPVSTRRWWQALRLS